MALTDLEHSRFSTLATLAARARKFIDNKSHHALAQKVAGTAFLIRVASAGMLFVSQILFARWMGTYEFGIYVYVWTWLLLIGALAPLGLAYLAQRFIPEYAARGDLDGLRGFLAGSRWICFALGTVAAIIGTVALMALGDRIAPYYIVPFLIAFACLPIFTVSSAQDAIATTYNWINLALVPGYIARPLLILAFLGAMYVAGLKIDAVAAMFAFLLGVWATTLLQFALLRKRLAREVPAGPRTFDVPHWMRTAAPVLLVDGFFFLLTYIDVLLLKLFVGPEQIAEYYAATKVLALVAFVYFAVTSACAHRFAEYHASGNKAELAAFVHASTRMVFWPSLAMVVLMILGGHWILMLFGPGFEAGYPLMLVLAAGLLARAAIGPAERLLNMVGQQKICAAVYAAAVAVNVVGCLVLVPRLGPIGAALATACAVVVESILLFLAVKKRVGVTMFIGYRLFAKSET